MHYNDLLIAGSVVCITAPAKIAKHKVAVHFVSGKLTCDMSCMSVLISTAGCVLMLVLIHFHTGELVNVNVV